MHNLNNQAQQNIKVISGGQTGVDRAALDAAIELGLEHGGWCPRGRKAEDGQIGLIYNLQETETDGYPERTRLNIVDSDGTLILIPYSENEATGGTLQTIQVAKETNKPCLVLDISQKTNLEDISKVISWINQNKIIRLNVAGPRESQSPGIHSITKNYLQKVLCHLCEIKLNHIQQPTL